MWRLLSCPATGVSAPAPSRAAPRRAGRRFAALWRNGDHGRLGMGVLESRWRPSVCPSSGTTDDIPCAIACGGAHTLFLTGEGRVFATGVNDFGTIRHAIWEELLVDFCRSQLKSLEFLKKSSK